MEIEEVVLPGGIPFLQNPSIGVTTDTLLLAASLKIASGSLVVDLGCAGGGAMVVSSAINPGCRWLGIDHQMDLLSTIEESCRIQRQHQDIDAVCCDIRNVPLLLSGGIAQAVITNPPFGRDGSGRQGGNRIRDLSRSGSDLLLYHFLRGASHLLEDGGLLLIVNRPARLPDILLGCTSMNIRPVAIQPIGVHDQPADHMVVHCLKNRFSELVLLPQVEPEEIMVRIIELDSVQVSG